MIRPTVQARLSWREIVEKIRNSKQVYYDNYAYMTQLESQTATQEINKMIKNNYDYIVNGLLADYGATVRNLKRAHERVEAEKQKEVASWDAGQLASEMQVYNMLVQQTLDSPPESAKDPGPVKALSEVYQEAQQSGDRYKQRAAAEVMKAANTKAAGLDDKDRIAVNRLAQQSKQDIKKVRTNFQVDKAYQETESAWEAWEESRLEVIKVSQTLEQGDPTDVLATGPLAQAVRCVQRTKDGLKIYDPDDPKILNRR